MASKKNNTKSATTLDWNKESERMIAHAKEIGGSRGDQLGKVATAVGGGGEYGSASETLRNAAGDAGAQAFIDCPRNVLAKLPKLAHRIASKSAWCSLAAMKGGTKANGGGQRTEDASVAVALQALGAGDERQKAIIASAQGAERYTGGANAQMSAALDALSFFGVTERTGPGRNAGYAIKNRKLADALVPTE